MEDKEIDLAELFKAIWAEKRLIIKSGIIGAIIGLVVAFSIPKTYESVVKIASEGNASSSNLGSMGGLAAMAGINLTSGSSAGISDNVYPEIMESTPFLLSLVQVEVECDDQKISFYDYITKYQKRAWWSYVIGAPRKFVGWILNIGKEKENENDKIDLFKPTVAQVGYVNALKQLIETSSDKKTKTISIKVKMQDPYIAAVIADSLLSNLQLYMINYKTSKSRADLENNEILLDNARERYYKLDSAYAIAQDRNQNLAMKSAQLRLERLSNEKDLAYSIYQQIATEVEVGRINVQKETPIATIIEPASVPIMAVSPQKTIIIMAVTFLAVFIVVFKIVLSNLLKKSNVYS